MLKLPFIIFSVYFYFNYLFSGLFLLIPVAILNKFYNKNTGFCLKTIYAINTSFIINNLLQLQIFVNSNKLINEITNGNQQSIVIQNHFSEIDFICISFILNNVKNIFEFKAIYISKKIVGLYLLGCGLFSFISKDIFLNRNINEDYNKLISNNNANILYMFPEGTCFNKFTKDKSDLYCNKNKLITFKYHLYPRITGIETIIKTHNKYKNIYDLTVIFDTISKKDYNNKYSLFKFFYQYDFPSRIFINISKYDIDKNIDITKKLEYIYLNKDNFIKNFNINQNKFKKINFNNKNNIFSFFLSNSITCVSIWLFYNFNYIKLFYFTEIIFFIIYFIFN